MKRGTSSSPGVGVFVLLLALGLSSRSFAEEKLFLLQNNSLSIRSAENGTLLQERSVTGATILAPTPGGKFIFVLNGETGLGLAVDFDNLQIAKPVDVSEQAPVRTLQFSPGGHTAYLVSEDETVTTFNHRAGELDNPEVLALPDGSTGTLAFNTRGTRLYRTDRNALGYFLESELKNLGSVALEGPVRSWTMAPSGRHLWGWTSTSLTLVDEPRKKIVRTVELESAFPPAFSADGLQVWSATRTGLVHFDSRRGRTLGSWTYADLNMNPPRNGLAQAAPVSDKTIWVVTEGSPDLVKFNPQSGRTVLTVPVPTNTTGRLVAVELKSGQGFACF